MSNHRYNVAIIGGGPAGLSAALYTSRSGLSTAVFAGSPPGGQLMLTSEVENFPGAKNILGPDLVQSLRDQSSSFGAKILDENIKSIAINASPFILNTTEKSFSADSIIVATGAKALWLGLDSETRLRGSGVSACATCDGFFFREKIVAVVGGGDTAMEEAQTLTKFAKKVYLIHRKDTFRASKIMQERVINNPKIEVIMNASITEIIGENKVERVMVKVQNPKGQRQTSDDRRLDLDGVFVAIGHKPDTELVKDILKLDEKGYVMTTGTKAIETAKLLNGLIVDGTKGQFNNLTMKQFDLSFQSMTSIPGIFAAGDCVDHTYRQAGTAAGMGIAAALDVAKWLENKL